MLDALETNAEPKSESAFCQPFTVGGVVEYSRRSVWRLVATAFFVLVFAALSAGWLVRSRWAPVLDSAVGRAPEEGRIHAGRLKWPATAEGRLAENGFLAVVVDPQDSKVSGQSADLQIELGGRELRLRSLFGFFPVPYDDSWEIPLDKAALTPIWQSWRPVLPAGVAAASALWILFSWAGLTLVYGLVFWLAAKAVGRVSSLWGAFKLAAAALMAPAVWMGVSILSYAFGTLNLGGFLVCFALHMVIPWFFLAIAPFKLAKAEIVEERLFAPEAPVPPEPKKSPAPKKRNPFTE